MTGLFPELTAEGLVLWRLHHMPNLELCACLREADGKLTLALRDPAKSASLGVSATNSNLSSSINRAIDLRDQFLAGGWEAVDLDLEVVDFDDVDFDEPD